MQSILGATLTTSVERIVASVLGASLGAIESTYFGSNLIVFALAIFLLGIPSFVLRLQKTSYRCASATLRIIVLIPRTDAPGHRGASQPIVSKRCRLESLSLLLLLRAGRSGGGSPITLTLTDANPSRKGYYESILRQHSKMLPTRRGKIA